MMKRTCVFLAALLTLAHLAVAYPIPPVPLWELLEKAELVVLARVDAVEDLPERDEEWNTQLARLSVVETFKGSPAKQLEVPFPGNMICPAPPDYVPGQKVLTFLALSQEDGTLYTVGLSYGTLYPKEEDLKDFRSAITSAVRIQGAQLGSEDLKEKKHSWAVTTAIMPGTRWHGLHEMRPGSERYRQYDRFPEQRPDWIVLTETDKSLLADAFVAAKEFRPEQALMLDVIEGFKSERVDRAALAWIEGYLQLDEPPYWHLDLMVKTLNRFGDTKAPARFVGRQATPETLRKIWQEAKAELAISDVAPRHIVVEKPADSAEHFEP